MSTILSNLLRVALMAITCFVSFSLSAQTGENSIRGTISGNGQPIAGATVQLSRSNAANILSSELTNEDGSFSFNGLADDVYKITVITIGYQNRTIDNLRPSAISNDIELTDEKVQDLNEVVVVGYGTQRKVNLTGAVDQITSEVLENRPVPNLSQGLQGVMPNLNLVPADGKPINSPAYNIRGTTSIGQGGNALVLIDGVEGDPSRINPNDIASISILKDAASAAIYGARAAFGVVLITTKNPKQSQTGLTYTFNHSIKTPTVLPKYVTNGLTFVEMFNEGFNAWNDYSQYPQNINKTVRFSQDYIQRFRDHVAAGKTEDVVVNANGEYEYYGNTDWYKLLYKDNTSADEHNLTFSGSGEKTNYMITGRFFNQKGLFRYNSDDYSIFNVRAKGGIDVFDWLQVYANTDMSQMKYHNPLNVGEGGGIWRNIADEGHTNVPLLNPDGTLTYSAAYSVGDYYYGKNGIDFNNRVIRSTVGFNSKFFNNTLRVKGDYTLQNTDNSSQRKRVPVPYSRRPGVIEYVGTNTNDIQENNANINYIATNTYAEYEPVFNNTDHSLKVLLGYNYETSTRKSVSVLRNGLISEDAEDLNLAIGQSITPTGGWERWVYLGGFGRINYAYQNKYLLEVNGRYDGSSKFPSHQRYAFFPSVSAGWRVSQESFWDAVSPTINDFKLRASYGELGNGNISSYAFMEQLGISQSGRILGGVRPQRTSIPGVIPAGLTWETSQTTNFGIDVGFLNNRLTFVGDYYIRKTKDMFTVGLEQPAVFGAAVPRGNYADLTTKGWEFVLQWRDQFQLASKPFGYGVRFTMNDSKSTIDKFNNKNFRLTDYYVGQTIGEIWGYTTDGFFTSEDEISKHASQNLIRSSNSGKILPGDIKFRDINGDKEISPGENTVTKPGDRSIIGNSSPRYMYGIMLDGSWNNFFASVFFQGIGKQDWYPGSEANWFWGQYNRPYNKIPEFHVGNIWTEDNPDAYLPRYRGYTGLSGRELNVTQTRYLQNAAYIRLKNIQVGYNFPTALVEKIKLKSGRIYFSGDNLWSHSPMYKNTKRMLDVENAIQGSDNVLTGGGNGDGLNYPLLKSFTIGLSLNF